MKLLNEVKVLVVLFCLFNTAGLAQQAGNAHDYFVDEKGVIRQRGSNHELFGFGVNYTVPFAHAYRSAQKLGVDVKKAIDEDVYHFARLGFDAFRVHVWDTEISDTAGNLLENEHLDLFDYLLAKLQERGIKCLVTPIAFWGNGWPEPDTYSPGFSHKYGKDGCLTNAAAIAAQQRYLQQFVNHKNNYTGIVYKNDASIVAFEISNEPHHREQPAQVTEYIQKLKDAIQSTGCQKPVFYNITHAIQLRDAYFKAGIAGGTFQWYPTGLGYGGELQGNLLPNVDDYLIPFAEEPAFKRIAKVVYEFDAADVARSYIYPAIARSFRTAGIQWATHFSYDPTYLAFANTEYNTHYMNLLYAPQKALALKIAGEVFHHTNRYQSFGKYPANTRFGPFSVSYKKDLAEMLTADKFMYTNHTNTPVPNAAGLKEIAGWGNSSLVQYGGSGAYFLDKISDGCWRLEVMPDAVWTDNLFGKNSLDKTRAVLNERSWSIQIKLPDLGEDFFIEKIAGSHAVPLNAQKGGLSVWPGVYLLKSRQMAEAKINFSGWKKPFKVTEFAPFSTTLKGLKLIHQPIEVANAGYHLPIKATVVSATAPTAVEAWITGAGWRSAVVKLHWKHGYEYEGQIPDSLVQAGILRYQIVVKQGSAITSFPAGEAKSPRSWDADANLAYLVPVVEPSAPVLLFNAAEDAALLNRPWLPGSKVLPGFAPGSASLEVNVPAIFKPDTENTEASPEKDYTIKHFAGNRLQGRKQGLLSCSTLVVKGRALNGRDCTVLIRLVSQTGQAYVGSLQLHPETGEYSLPISSLTVQSSVILPRPYPGFLPYYFKVNEPKPLNLSEVETVQVSCGPLLPGNKTDGENGYAIEAIWLK